MRGKKAPKRDITPDPRYNSPQVAKFINYVMKGGKKSIATQIVYAAFDLIEDKTKKPGLEIFEAAMKNISPNVEVRGRRIGGANYQIPIQVKADRRFILASRWLLEAVNAKKGKSFASKLAEELMSAANKEGAAMKKRENVHRMADANRAFAHFAR